MVAELQHRVLEAVREGSSLVEIDSAIIEPARLDEDEKAALWLYAGSLRDLGTCERELALHEA